MRALLAAGAAALLLTAAMPQVRAADITVATASATSTADPHFHNVGPNNMLAMHVFSALTATDAHDRVIPRLASSWQVKDDHTWVFHLVTTNFQDGTPFTANDVVYTFCRMLKTVGPTHSFTQASKSVDRIEVPDPHTVILHTRLPDPTLPALLADFYMISAHSGGVAADIRYDPANQCGVPLPTSADFDSLKMANGTGPYRLTRYVNGDVAVLEANHHYFGAAPHWNRVVLRPVPNAGARVAGLLAGDYDLIEDPAAQNLRAIKARGFAYAAVPSERIIFLQPDIGRAVSPEVRAGGKNPLQDPRVREAISMAIDRGAIVSRIMDGLAEVADQYVHPGLPGTIADPPARPYDPAGARKLLAEAGYPNGFALTLSATNDRYINDARVAQALGQFLARVGIRTTVDAMPANMFFPRRAKRSFSLAMGGWGPGPRATIGMFIPWTVSTDLSRGIGGSNYGAYHSAAFDAAFLKALSDMNDASREKLLQQATRIALVDNALIPLYWETSLWAFKSRYTFQGRVDQITDVDALGLKAK